jgi:hypothetical protein
MAKPSLAGSGAILQAYLEPNDDAREQPIARLGSRLVNSLVGL